MWVSGRDTRGGKCFKMPINKQVIITCQKTGAEKARASARILNTFDFFGSRVLGFLCISLVS